MSYFDVAGPEQLIARRGYAGLEEPLGGIMDKIGKFVSGAGKAALNIYDSGKTSEGQAQAAKEIAAQQAAAARGSSMPSWALPAGLAVAGVAVFMVMKKRK